MNPNKIGNIIELRGDFMDDNKERNEQDYEKHYHSSKTDYMLKLALILLAVFLACYLAVYYVLDQMRHAYYIPSAPIENIDRIMREQDRMFNEMSAFPMHNSAMMALKSPVETYKDDTTDSYKMIVNLKPFDNNPKNVELTVDGNHVKIKAAGEKNKHNSEKLYAFSQSFVLPDKIDESKITKEKIKNKYIITLPIDD